MDSTNSSFQISMDSSFGSVNIPGIDINEQIEKILPTKGCASDDRLSLLEDIIRIYLKHHTSLECLTDWVKLLNTRLDDYEKLPPGKVQLMELFWRNHPNLANVTFFVKCDKCNKSTKVQADQKQGLKCHHCHKLLKTNETNFFVILSVKEQIVKSIEDNWTEICEYDQSCDTEDSKCYRDARDGSILKEILQQYESSDINVLSLCLNVDGANKFRSNSFSVWPIQLMQNFLPPHCRFLPKNIILSGLYYHKSKENEQLTFHEYLRPLVDELNHLKENPISMNMDNRSYKFKPVITHCSVDLPARSKLQEMKQFGGYDACPYCEIKGEKVIITKPKLSAKKSSSTEIPTKPKYFVRYTETDGSFNLRSEIDTLQKMLIASGSGIGNKVSIGGIKDVSPLVGLEHFNIIWSMSVEYMHLCLLGVEKRLMDLFFNPKYSHKDHYIGPSQAKVLSRKIMNIKPTSSIVRKPRPLTQLPNFKASEHRSMLLYYLPVCLPGSIPNKYVKHLRLFSAAVYILLQRMITYENVDKAEEMMCSFVKQHQDLFGKESMVMVIHIVKHIAECVRQLGPLWSHSAFAFERNNGCLLKLAVGTTDVLHQISTKYCLGKAINVQDVKDNPTIQKNQKILLGKPVNVKELSRHVFDISSLEILPFSNVSLSVHKRIRYAKLIYTSTMYTRPKRSVDYFIGLKSGEIGTAKYYFTYNERICVMLEEYEIIESISHIDKVLSTKRMILASVDEIDKKYIFMTVGLNKYIVCRPNPFENE
ncbi:uncharacterized protein LOC119083069 [Bradysia coprophila]|uniref:uncharacterized protein LOC119083069 n=1 Tax=Bradysia coprophila TaxID=38358 RepID=UPI00187D8645|nr:uncharacterized protein LOC119083069 [Bradysia coprophila]